MKPFLNSRSKRSTAFVVLWVWLFALACGAANACLFQTETMHDHNSRAAHSHSSSAEREHAISAAHGDAITDLDSGIAASKSQCLKGCDDGSQSVSRPQVNFDFTHPVLVPLLVVAYTTATPVVSARGMAVIQRRADPRLPIRVGLSRLAL